MDSMAGAQAELTLPGLARAAARRSRPPTPVEAPAAAAENPVARVLVDVPLAHLDRPFDYLVTEPNSAAAVPGARVRIRFAGQEVGGFILERRADSDHTGRLSPLRRVVSAEPVLTTEVAALTAAVAARYAGTRSDVLRLAVPSRHAATERAPSRHYPLPTVAPDPTTWSDYGAATALTDLAAGASPRLVLTALPGDPWPELITEAVVATAASGRGVLVCVPSHRDLTRLDVALRARIGADHHVVLSAEHGPARRYRAFLALARGDARIAIGTRSAAFAPVPDLGLVVVWDDGDDLHAEPRAPYPHVREVLLLRADQQGCGFLAASYARSVEAEYLVHTGWAGQARAERAVVRRRIAVSVADRDGVTRFREPTAVGARVPPEVFDVIRSGLRDGPVLIHTPRSGYLAGLACDTCRTAAICAGCAGPLRIIAPGLPPECAWCATAVPGWACPGCGGRGLRAPVLGDLRTAEELGRAFPSIPVRTSSADQVIDTVSAKPALVVATPGAEPVAAGGYAAVVLLDTWLPLARADLRAGEEAVRRWANAIGLIAAGGRVIAVGDPDRPELQALVRWDPAGFAARELVDRQETHLAPASRMATLSGPAAELEAALDRLHLPVGAEVLGPVLRPAAPGEDAAEGEHHRYVLRVPRRYGDDLSAALSALQAHRSAHKRPHLRVEVDPVEIG